jgi:hypothetical protein
MKDQRWRRRTVAAHPIRVARWLADLLWAHGRADQDSERTLLKIADISS